MPKRRREAVDDSDVSAIESSETSEAEEKFPAPEDTVEDGDENNYQGTGSARRERLRLLREAKLKEEEEEPQRWPVVLKTNGKTKQADESEESEFDASESSIDTASDASEDEKFELSDGGFIVDSDDNVVPSHRTRSGGSQRRKRSRSQLRSRSGFRSRRGRPRKYPAKENGTAGEVSPDSDDEFTASDASLAEELRELKGDSSPARRGRNYRARAPVDYSIPPAPTIEEVAQATARSAEIAARAKARDPRARRLFDVRGPFGGKDVHTLFNLSREDLEQVVSSNPSNADSAILKVSSSIPGAQQATGPSTNADIDPVDISDDVDFSMVGGLDDYISKLKEMISLPLLYPELYERFGITPPRGVLFHGPPGTGKTLMARALAASHKHEKVTFYMRKGADVLSKWIGESERQLRALFDEARANQPSIIFFDEIDGLAPVRSAKQEQNHTSIVSTLLALMDGMDNRGQVVVIGATNRPDSVDPALRRPGRFDREFYFPLPDDEARRRILRIHTQKWNPPLTDEFVASISRQTKGYGGADIRALTTEAALLAIQRAYPQIYTSSEKLMLDPSSVEVRSQDFALALEKIQPSTARSAGTSLSQPLPTRIQPLLQTTFASISARIHAVFPVQSRESQSAALFLNDAQFKQSQITKSVAKGRIHRPRLLLEGAPGNGQSYLSRAISNLLEGVYVRELSLASIFGAGMGAIQPESAVINAVSEARQRAPACILLPALSDWEGVPHLANLLVGQLRSLLPSEQILVVGTEEAATKPDGPSQSSALEQFFGTEVINIQLDTDDSILVEFFKPVLDFIKRSPLECLEAHEISREDPPQLPVAPKPISNTETLPTSGDKETSKSTNVFSETERAELRIRSQLKLKLGVILDGFRQRYRRFRKPVVDEQQLVHLFEISPPPMLQDGKDDVKMGESDRPPEMEPGQKEGVTFEEHQNTVPDYQDKTSNIDAAAIDDEEDDYAYVLTQDNMILEKSSGKRYYNMDLETVEDRLWNGFYCEPQQFLEDMEMIYRDANVNGERERIHKASEMLANAQVAIDDISSDKLFVAACKELHAKDAKVRLDELNPSSSDCTEIADANADQKSKDGAVCIHSVEPTPVELIGDSNGAIEEDRMNVEATHKQPHAKFSLQDLLSGPPVAAISESSQVFVKPQSSATADRHVELDSQFFDTLVKRLTKSASYLSLEQLEHLYAELSELVWLQKDQWDRTQILRSVDNHLPSILAKISY